MRHRMRAIGGEFQVQSGPGKGTEITVLAPLEDAVQE
jgi:signal transduction histidine kinase